MDIFPHSVIKGMLADIGIIIFKKQIPIAFGHKGFSNCLSDPSNFSSSSLTITLVSLVILILWEQRFMKQIKVFQLIQGPLIVVIVGILMTIMFNDFGGEHLVSIPVAKDFTELTNQVWSSQFVLSYTTTIRNLSSLMLLNTFKMDKLA